ncbi:MAG: hypothetical protein RIQ93_2476 [Verrucomicrobiota bacterium]
MTFESWILAISGLLLLIGFGAVYVSRLPFTTTIVCLGIGALLGPAGWAVLNVDPLVNVELFHRAAEVTVVISLFSVGLKLGLPWRDKRWIPALLLAFVSMGLTVGFITVVGVSLLGLPLGGAVLLGAILAPTDPVLASDVQLEHSGDRNELRLALSGEAGFNDGTAFPFVMLGLGWLGLHDLGAGGWRWWSLDVAWAIVCGLGIGAALGYLTGRLILVHRRREPEAASLHEYLLLGLIGLAYGAAVKLHAYGFLAVFAAGVAVRAGERSCGRFEPEQPARLLAPRTDQLKTTETAIAPAVMAGAMLSFNEQLERIVEVGMVLLVGAALAVLTPVAEAVWFVPVLFFAIRPFAVLPVWFTRRFTPKQFAGVAWFGIRGIGSIYYLMYAIDRGLAPELARTLTSLTFIVVGASILAHGVSVTPLMRLLQKRTR